MLICFLYAAKCCIFPSHGAIRAAGTRDLAAAKVWLEEHVCWQREPSFYHSVLAGVEHVHRGQGQRVLVGDAGDLCKYEGHLSLENESQGVYPGWSPIGPCLRSPSPGIWDPIEQSYRHS